MDSESIVSGVGILPNSEEDNQDNPDIRTEMDMLNNAFILSPAAEPSCPPLPISPANSVTRETGSPTPEKDTSHDSIILTPRPQTPNAGPAKSVHRDYVRKTPSGGTMGTPRHEIAVKGRNKSCSWCSWT